MRRDKINQEKLIKTGWKILILWQCELGKKKKETTLGNVLENLKLTYESISG